MKLALIVAMAENRVIGRDNALPWHLPADLKRFKALTMGHTLVMGRKTHESIGRVLPGRRTIVLSRQPGYESPGVEVATRIEDALYKALTANAEILFAIGGADVFRAALPWAHLLYLTLVHAEPPGDVLLPAIDESHWQLVREEPHAPDEKHALAFTFRDYVRVRMVTVHGKTVSATEPTEPHGETVKR